MANRYEVKHVLLEKLNWNPYRDRDTYPIRKEVIAQLKTSFRKAKVWPSIIARETNHGIEIAFGHHRCDAARELVEEDKEFAAWIKAMRGIPVIFEKLDDAQMIQYMANENLDDYGHDFRYHIETIKAVVRAFGEGKIELNLKNLKRATVYRVIGSWIPQKRGDDGDDQHLHKKYTIQSVADFLGWTYDDGKVRNRENALVARAFKALELEESGAFKISEIFNGLGPYQAKLLMTNISQSLRNDKGNYVLARKVAGAARTKIKEAQERASENLRQKMTKKPKPNVLESADQICVALGKILNDDPVGQRLSQLIEHDDELTDYHRERLCRELQLAIGRAQDFVDVLTPALTISANVIELPKGEYQNVSS